MGLLGYTPASLVAYEYAQTDKRERDKKRRSDPVCTTAARYTPYYCKVVFFVGSLSTAYSFRTIPGAPKGEG